METISNPWRVMNSRLVPYAVLFTIGIIIASFGGNIRTGHVGHRFIDLIGIIIFLFFANLFLRTVANIVYSLFTEHHLSTGRAGAIKFLIHLFGYLVIALVTLDLLGVSIAKLLLGSAVIGIILGVAAQQALGNFFASIVLIFAHPFTIGEDIELVSGTLGGKYTGKVLDLGLTHTRLKDEKGNVIYMPNATLLSAAAIMAKKRRPKVETEESKK